MKDCKHLLDRDSCYYCGIKLDGTQVSRQEVELPQPPPHKVIAALGKKEPRVHIAISNDRKDLLNFAAHCINSEYNRHAGVNVDSRYQEAYNLINELSVLLGGNATPI